MTTPTKPVSGEGRSLTANDRVVIRARHFGWEHASPGLLAKVFGVSVQRITAVLKASA